MILYHFPTSPFARRVRLALAMKGQTAELRDARADAAHLAEVQRINPMHSVPVLVDGERVISDSMAICEYVDAKWPVPALWAGGIGRAEAMDLVVACNDVMTPLVDLGLRYQPLKEHARWEEVRAMIVGRVQRSLDRIAGIAATRGAILVGERWGMADIAVLTTALWLEGLPARAEKFPLARQIVELGWRTPPALSTWADAHRGREDVLAFG